MAGLPEELNTALKQAYETKGVKGYWRKRLELAEQQKKPNAWVLARLHIELGNPDQALRFLHQAYEERSSQMTFLSVNPLFASLPSDPRFQELMHLIQVPKQSVPLPS